MVASKRGEDLIKSFESCKLTAYKVGSDKVTIGWGNTTYEDGSPVKLGDVITQDRADYLFKIILGDFEDGVCKRLKVRLNNNQFDALVSFAYNLGLGNLDKSTLLKKVNANPNDPSIRTEFLKWISKGSIFEKGLRRRRAAEADLYFKTI